MILFLKYKFIYFNWRLITLQYCIGFVIYQHESTTGIHVYIHPGLSSLLPPCTIPLGRPGAPAPSIQYHALNLDWRFVSYMILHMFQCHSPKSSPPPPTESKRLSYTSVSCCLEYRVIILCFCFVWPRDTWDLSLPTRDRTLAPCIGKRSLNR